MLILFACSGPGAPATIGRNILFSFSQAAVVGLLFWASLALRRRSGRPRRTFPALCLALLVLHPAWWVSAVSGDCGYFKAGASAVFSGAAVVLVSVQAASAVVAKRRGRQQPSPDSASP